MKQQLVYDLPTRFFHWLFTILFLTAFIIAKTVDDDTPLYSYHMLAGMILGFLVFLRVIWGVIGSKHARFSKFPLKPTELFAYFKGIASGSKQKWAGHNPASSWATIVMFALAIGLGITGFLMTSGGNKEAFEDIHELLANTFIVVVILHVAGVILHTIRHREAIGLSMVTGNKADVSDQDAISSSHSLVGYGLLVLVFAFGLNLYKNYDTQTQVLNLFGTQLQLGENEKDEKNTENHGTNGEGKSEDEDGDDD